MKKWIAVSAAIAIALGVWLFLFKNITALSGASPGKIAAENSAVTNALAKQNPAAAIINSNFMRVQTPPENLGSAVAGKNVKASSIQPAPLQFTNFAPVIVLENMRRAIRQYGEMFGGNPIGNNTEIASQLGGNNPKHINFLKAEAGMRVNEKGELVDPWGTPFFFHQLSGKVMEIRSAGSDGVMWTSDDLVVR